MRLLVMFWRDICMKKRLISLIICILLLTGCDNGGYETITENTANELISNNNVVIIDVRNIDEYNTGHIKGAINIPVSKIDEVSYDKNQYIIVYCASGMRSSNAAQVLVDLGYTNVYNLDGGLINWGAALEE